MARRSMKKAENDSAEDGIFCVYCELRFTEAATLYRHIRQNHTDKK